MEKKKQLELVREVIDLLGKAYKKTVVKAKKCNFYNRGFCNQGSSCGFDHGEIQLCESFQTEGICIQKYCNKRHLYKCKYLTRNGGCFIGDDCAFSHNVRAQSSESDTDASVHGYENERIKVDGKKSEETIEKVNDDKEDEKAAQAGKSDMFDTPKHPV